MKRIPKRVRDEAILICAIAASSRQDPRPNFMNMTTQEIARRLESQTKYGLAAALALCAWWRAAKTERDPDCRHAEAECLLRSGWSPS